MPLNSLARRARVGVPAAIAATVVALSGCGGDGGPTSDIEDQAALTMEDAWVKAAESGMMTAAFGILVNPGENHVRVVSARTPVSPTVELHEVAVVDGAAVMRRKDGGFTVPAGGEHALEPGADHLMIMEVSDPLEPGEDVDLVLVLDDGSTVEVTAQVKDFAGADEDYVPGEHATGHDDE